MNIKNYNERTSEVTLRLTDRELDNLLRAIEDRDLKLNGSKAKELAASNPSCLGEYTADKEAVKHLLELVSPFDPIASVFGAALRRGQR